LEKRQFLPVSMQVALIKRVGQIAKPPPRDASDPLKHFRQYVRPAPDEAEIKLRQTGPSDRLEAQELSAAVIRRLSSGQTDPR
jgi:hypothetical protein